MTASQQDDASPSTSHAPGVERSAALAAELAEALRARGPAYVPRTRHLGPGGAPLFTNRLVREASPYLLQHAHNPVDWHPWGDEAFAEARRLGRPVFLSIGYATCHWCHVMEEESFEDPAIAAFLNQHFIPIKVDREERPDVDAVYMSAVQALTGQGGWPMSVFLTPAREPFYGGTYFPPHDGARGARIGFRSLLEQLQRTYAEDGERIQRASASLVAAVKEQMEGATAAVRAAVAADRAPIELALRTYARLFDDTHGGLRRAPKFPSNIPVRVLLRVLGDRGVDREALLHMATLTLTKMAAGGMYDQLGGGFHRYSTDAQWLVPHFEKMLYDNALLVPAYVEAYQVTGEPLFARVARETLDYLLREMTAPAGGFYSATDADSAGPDGKREEGLFFVWSEDEIRQHLDGDVAARFLQHYGVTPQGNFEGHNILFTPSPDEAAHTALGEARKVLYDVRAHRPPPLLDDKILAAWNGLAISAFAIAGRVLDEPRYVEAARRAASFVLAEMKAGDRVLRAYRAGSVPRAVGFLEDQAFVVQGLLDLSEASFADGDGARWLREALALAEAQEAHFADARGGGWFMTADDGEALIAREKPQYDGAEPSGTSVAWRNALRLHALTDEPRWREVAARAHTSVADVLVNNPLALSEGLLALAWMTGTPREIVIVTPAEAGAESARPLLEVLAHTFVPHRVLVVAAEGSPLAPLVPLLRDRPAVAGQATAYVCSQGRCDLPVTEPAALARLLTTPSAAG